MPQHETGLTAFLCAMLKATPEQIARADPVKMAAKYRVNEQHVRGYLRLEGGNPHR